MEVIGIHVNLLRMNRVLDLRESYGSYTRLIFGHTPNSTWKHMHKISELAINAVCLRQTCCSFYSYVARYTKVGLWEQTREHVVKTQVKHSNLKVCFTTVTRSLIKNNYYSIFRPCVRGTSLTTERWRLLAEVSKQNSKCVSEEWMNVFSSGSQKRVTRALQRR